MFKMKRFIVPLIITITLVSQTALAAVPKLNKNTYDKMTASEIAKKYKENGIEEGVTAYKLEVPLEWNFATSDVTKELGSECIDDTNLEEDKSIKLFEEAVLLIGNKEFDKEIAKCSINYPRFTKFIEPGIKKASVYLSDENNKLIGVVQFDIIINIAGTQKVEMPKEIKAIKISEIKDRREYTFPDFPRESNELVASDKFYSEEKASKIYELFETGKISGSSDGFFYPKFSVTRAEFATMLVNILEYKNKSGLEKFSDIRGHWAKSAIDTIWSYGLMKGVSSDKFDPNGKITYEQIAVICERILESNGKTIILTDKELYDINLHATLSYGKEAVAKCLKAKLFEETNYFFPTDPATREDATIIIYELRQMIKR